MAAVWHMTWICYQGQQLCVRPLCLVPCECSACCLGKSECTQQRLNPALRKALLVRRDCVVGFWSVMGSTFEARVVVEVLLSVKIVRMFITPNTPFGLALAVLQVCASPNLKAASLDFRRRQTSKFMHGFWIEKVFHACEGLWHCLCKCKSSDLWVQGESRLACEANTLQSVYRNWGCSEKNSSLAIISLSSLTVSYVWQEGFDNIQVHCSVYPEATLIL